MGWVCNIENILVFAPNVFATMIVIFLWGTFPFKLWTWIPFFHPKLVLVPNEIFYTYNLMKRATTNLHNDNLQIE